MSDSARLAELVERRLAGFCDEKREQFHEIDPELAGLIASVQRLLTGGKRFRALFAYWAWASVLPDTNDSETQRDRERASIAMIDICASLEMFHAAALVHDDVMDSSDTRRGFPSVHKQFENLHESEMWVGSKDRFGQAVAIIAGDMMLGWSSDLFERGLKTLGDPERAEAARSEFSRMRFEVMAGQYLDVLEENSGPVRKQELAVSRANRVMLYKTAKYSIEAPMLIGAAVAGAEPAIRRGLTAFAIPLGMAFQLRDDVLGVFGDSTKTGKPAGDDLREGKRTILVALSRESLGSSTLKIFDELLSNRALTQEQITLLQQTIKGCGALERVEYMIDEYGRESLRNLEALSIESYAKAQLDLLAKKVLQREN